MDFKLDMTHAAGIELLGSAAPRDFSTTKKQRPERLLQCMDGGGLLGNGEQDIYIIYLVNHRCAMIHCGIWGIIAHLPSNTHLFRAYLHGGFKYFLCSHRNLGKMNPIWRAYFSKGLVETTNQFNISGQLLATDFHDLFSPNLVAFRKGNGTP